MSEAEGYTDRPQSQNNPHRPTGESREEGSSQLHTASLLIELVSLLIHVMRAPETAPEAIRGPPQADRRGTSHGPDERDSSDPKMSVKI